MRLRIEIAIHGIYPMWVLLKTLDLPQIKAPEVVELMIKHWNCGSLIFKQSNTISLCLYTYIEYRHACLVGGLEHFLFSHSVGNDIIPTDFH